MKKAFIGIAACAAALVVALAAILSTPPKTPVEDGTDMHRLYNPNSGEHFYTASRVERDRLQSVGWSYERVAWASPESGEDVYRVYNPNGGDHHYTTSSGERDQLVKSGWRDEGSGWKSGGSVAVYRLYNPKAATGAHHYTTSAGERNQLVAASWRDEGVGWYATSEGGAPEATLYLAGSNWLVELPEYWNDKVSIYTGLYNKGASIYDKRALDKSADTNWILVYADGVDEPKVNVMRLTVHEPGRIDLDDAYFAGGKTDKQVTLANGSKAYIYQLAEDFENEIYYAPLSDGYLLEVFACTDLIHELGKPISEADRQILIDLQTLGAGATGEDPAEYARDVLLTELASHTYLF